MPIQQQSILEKAKNIRLLILDVDGILTDGMIYYGNDGEPRKGFHIHDGLGIKLLQRAGIPVAIISGKTSIGVETRLKELNIQHYFLGKENKLPIYESLKQNLQLADHEIAYMGDDLPDLPLLKRVALAVTVPQASEFIRKHCDYVTQNNAGNGAVREVCEDILQAQSKLDELMNAYLTPST